MYLPQITTLRLARGFSQLVDQRSIVNHNKLNIYGMMLMTGIMMHILLRSIGTLVLQSVLMSSIIHLNWFHMNSFEMYVLS